MRRGGRAFRMARGVAGVALVALTGTVAAGAPVEVELELAIAVDVSGSVDAAEFDLQLRGLAAAFRDPGVAAAIRATGRNGIAVAVLQWACPGRQARAVDWTQLKTADDARRLADRIAAAGRLLNGETSIEYAIRYAVRELEANRFAGRRRVIGISGDGRSHAGDDTADRRDRAVAAGFTINGLAILNDEPDLDRYYRESVVGGTGAFLVVADDYEDFVAAIRRKLIREIAGPAVALLSADDEPRRRIVDGAEQP